MKLMTDATTENFNSERVQENKVELSVLPLIFPLVISIRLYQKLQQSCSFHYIYGCQDSCYKLIFSGLAIKIHIELGLVPHILYLIIVEIFFIKSEIPPNPYKVV